MKTIFTSAKAKRIGAKTILSACLLLFANTYSARAVDYYWVGGTGNWSDFANHWATTSGGGVFHANVPTLNDNVFFDANSFLTLSDTVYTTGGVASNSFCRSFIWNSVIGFPTFYQQNTLNIGGAFVLSPNLKFRGYIIQFSSTTVGNTLNTNGVFIEPNYASGQDLKLVFNNASAGWSLQSDLILFSTDTLITQIIFEGGTFNTNGFDIVCYDFLLYCSQHVNLNLSSSTLNIYKQYFAVTIPGGFTLNTGTSRILLGNATVPGFFYSETGNYNYVKGGSVYIRAGRIKHAIAQQVQLLDSATIDSLEIKNTGSSANYGSYAVLGNDLLTKVGNCTVNSFHLTVFQGTLKIDSLTLNNPGDTISLNTGTTLKINSLFAANATSANKTVIKTYTPGVQETLDFGTLDFCADNLVISDIAALGSGNHYAGANSIDAGNNTGWNFSTCSASAGLNYYWVGGTGNWSDVSHWATASGGTIFYTTPPDSTNDVYFDANSFLTASDTIYSNTNVLCRNFDWTNSTGSPVYKQNGARLDIYGSAILNPNMDLLILAIYFASNTTGNTINTNGAVFHPTSFTNQNAYIVFSNPNGEWVLNADLVTGYNGVNYSVVRLKEGTLNTNGYAVRCYDFDIFPNPVCSLYLDTSSIYCDNSFYALVSAASFNLDASQSKIYAGLVNLNAGFSSANHDYNYVESSTMYGSDCNFNHVVSGGYLYDNSNIGLQEIKKPATAPSTWIQNLFCTAAPTTIRKIIINSNPLTWVSGNKFTVDTLILNNAGDTLSIQGNDTVVVTSQFIANSTAGSPIYIKSNNPGVASNFDFGSNDVCVDNLVIKENNALGTGNHYAGGNSVDSGGNAGWNFATCVPSIYHPFPDSNATWNFYTGASMCMPFFGTINMNYSITLSGDTLINSQTYHKLFIPFVSADTTSCCCTPYINSGFQGSVRQDIPNRKVFYVPPADSVEQLLYDFNMQVGDTVRGFLESMSISPGTVQSIDSVLVGSGYRKRWNINPNYFISLIEGVGSTYGLIQFSPHFIDGAGFMLNCHTQNGITLYPDTANYCPLIVNTLTEVWPGDANYDLVVNNFDVLNIGLAYNETGPVRPAASNFYIGQPANDWTNFFQTAVNKKHADCNGDGIVNDNDTVAIALNYGQNHPAHVTNPNPQTVTAASLYIEINPDSASLSDTLDVDIFLGTSTTPVDSIYGIAFTISFDTAYIDTASVSFDYTGNWMGTPGVDLLTFQKTRFLDGAIDMAMVRTDHQNIAGFGFLERIGIVVVDNIGARISTPFTLSNVRAITASEYELTINTSGDSLSLDTTSSVGIHEMENLQNMISVYPNPAKDKLTIHSGAIKMSSVEIYNSMGEMVINQKVNSNVFTANTTNLQQGVYLVRCVTEKGILNKRIVVAGKE